MTHSKVGSSVNNNVPKGHKRQASIGLGIVTATSKNNSFFEMNSTSTLKPPPRITHPIIIMQPNHTEPNRFSTTFANRIRHVVLANRKPSTARRSSVCGVGCNSPTGHHFSNDEIIPLPSPTHAETSSEEDLFAKHALFTPIIDYPIEETPPTSAIPILSHSPSFSPSKKNIIPSLLDEPMLGDLEENNVSQVRQDIALSGQGEQDFLIGKHIWKFRIKQLLGVGAFSHVFLAQDIEGDSGYFAIKMINKELMYSDTRIKSSIEREVGVLKFLNHNHIVQLEATMETQQHLCIVLEYVQGQELFEFVEKMHTNLHGEGSENTIDEALIKKLMIQLIDTVTWLHAHNIVHRDLKLENILVYYDDQGEAQLKITDFGLARVVDPNEPTLTTRCGSEEYAAPEIVQSIGYDGRSTDTWCIGIILYALLVGYLPFTYNAAKGEKLSHLFHRIVTAQVKWPSEDKISLEAKEVVDRILLRQAEKRISLDQIKSLNWFKK